MKGRSDMRCAIANVDAENPQVLFQTSLIIERDPDQAAEQVAHQFYACTINSELTKKVWQEPKVKKFG